MRKEHILDIFTSGEHSTSRAKAVALCYRRPFLEVVTDLMAVSEQAMDQVTMSWSGGQSEVICGPDPRILLKAMECLIPSYTADIDVVTHRKDRY